MQIIDYVIIGIAVIGLIVGLCRGLIKQLLVLLGIVAVAVGTSYLFVYPCKWFGGIISNQQVLSIVSIVLTVIVLGLIYGGIAKVIYMPFKNVKVIKATDRLLGAVLGVAIVYALVALFVALTTSTNIGFMQKINNLLAGQMNNSVIVKSVYANNFFGNWSLGVISNAML